MRVKWSRVLAVRRADPYRLSVGDEADADFSPGLLELLNLRRSGGERLGETLAPEWVLPIGAVGTAAFALVGEEFQPWTATANTVELRRPFREDETVLATAVVESMRRVSVNIRYRAVSRERGDVLLEGSCVFACVGPEGPRAFDRRLVARRAEGAAPVVPPGDPVVSAPSGAKPSSRKAAILDRLVPERAARKLRLAYWHLKDLRRALDAPPGPARSPAPAIRWSTAFLTLRPGETADLAIELGAADSAREIRIRIAAPFGHGLDVAPETIALRLPAGTTVTVPIRIVARRPHEVNLGRPWSVTASLAVAGVEVAAALLDVAVPDPEPGRLFYVLTEDCETFDGGARTGSYGALAVLGNRNDFMDPEDYRVQMIEKPDALNAIAEKHAARWTHFWTVPQRFAAEWAARRSKTGAWTTLIADLDESVRRGSRRHEYAPHVHFDYETESKLPPQPRLLYDEATDGILPNDYYDPATNPDHRYHGWDGARKGIAYVRAEGGLDDVDSKKGSLRRAVRHLARLSFPAEPSRITRTGAADFGGTASDLAASARALVANGLFANSDAGVYRTDAPLPRGRQMYFCRGDDLDLEIEDLAEAALVELRAPEQQLEQGTLADLNAWFDRRAAESRGPGVRAVVAMTHAMFVKGSPDPFRDASGEDFEKIDRHLLHVRRAHPDVRFATASEAALEFLDYYTPVPLAVATRPIWRSEDSRISIFPVRILGRGIPISPWRPARLKVQAPSFADPGDVQSLAVLEDGELLSGTHVVATAGELPCVEFTATRSGGYALRVETRGAPADSARQALFESGPDDERRDLLRLDGPRLVHGRAGPVADPRSRDAWIWRYPGDLFRLLVHPVAGNTDPLGRRLHPFGRLPEGMAIDAARRLFGDALQPRRFELALVRPIRGDADFEMRTSVEEVSPESLVLANTITEAGVEVARVRLELARVSSGAA